MIKADNGLLYIDGGFRRLTTGVWLLTEFQLGYGKGYSRLYDAM